jgi:hypothetical protein
MTFGVKVEIVLIAGYAVEITWQYLNEKTGQNKDSELSV